MISIYKAVIQATFIHYFCCAMKQHYANYTPADFEVWDTLYSRQMLQLPAMASRQYLDSLKTVGFSPSAIPNFEEVNGILKAATGWQLHVVPSIISNAEFFPLLAQRKFPATTWLRPMESLDYLEEPDMFHDVFGHVPLLSHPTFCAFFDGFASIGMRYLDRPELLDILGRMYWFTIEFGLIREGDAVKIYGAGILSSHGESKYSLSDAPTHKPFNVAEILRTDYDNTRIQELYFVIDSYEQLFESLADIEAEMEKLAS